jgi:hypothetical protein
MANLIPAFPSDGVVTVNRVILKPQYTVDDLQERVAVLCENVKTYHSDTGFVGGFVALNSGAISNEGSTAGQAQASPMQRPWSSLFGAASKNTRSLIVATPSSRCFSRCLNFARTAMRKSPTACFGLVRPTVRKRSKLPKKPRHATAIWRPSGTGQGAAPLTLPCPRQR